MVESSPQRAEAQVPKAGGRTGPGKTAAQGGAKSPKDRKKGECLFCFVLFLVKNQPTSFSLEGNERKPLTHPSVSSIDSWSPVDTRGAQEIPFRSFSTWEGE